MKKVYLSFFGVLAFGLVGVAQKNVYTDKIDAAI